MLLREGENGNRIPSGCAISGIFSKSGKRINGEAIIDSIAVMHDRSNGLGGGVAGYSIYLDYKIQDAFQYPKLRMSRLSGVILLTRCPQSWQRRSWTKRSTWFAA